MRIGRATTWRLAAICSAFFALWPWYAPADEPAPPGPVPPGTVARPLGIVAFTEGPAYHADGSVYFSDVENDRILRSSNGQISVFRHPAGRANGLLFDHQGRLLACEGAAPGGRRRVTRTEPDGTLTVLAERYQGHRLNSPNDLTIDSHGRIYFSDPRYGDREDLEQRDAQGLPVEAVYRIDPGGQLARILGPGEVTRPNGLAVSPDDRWLYVIDNDNSRPDGDRKVWSFALSPEGQVVPGSRRAVYDFGPGRGGDGLEVDRAGRLYVAAGTNLASEQETVAHPAGVYVLSPEGQQLGFIPVSEDMCTNCAFGGPDFQTLFITAGHKLWSARLAVPGHAAWPRPTP